MRLLFLGLLACCSAFAQPARTVSRTPEPPELPRELRGTWVATIANLDWPSRPGLPVAQQQAELRAVLDNAVRLNLNTVILQVRANADAMYPSTLEPWSEYLTGRMGQAPNPLWDPLQFACEEAHARCLELHAWINPFRARYSRVVSPIAPNHVLRTHPEWIIAYGLFRWLDPGQPAVREHVLNIAFDIVRRYDVDGLHIDDYFYPYPTRRPDGVLLPFPDNASFGRYRRDGGQMSRDDWRRSNINQFVEALYRGVHRIKPWVKVGISPFGIWRPDHPSGIRGLDSYAHLFADSRLWLNSGWCDYFAPQLYWPLSRPEQSFQRLLQWWDSQNTLNRLMVPGLNSAKIGEDRQANDIANQIRIARRDYSDGVIFWNASSLRNNLGGVADGLTRELFARPALVPATPWLGASAPLAPKIEGTLSLNNNLLTMRWEPDTNEVTRCVVFRSRLGVQWQDQILNSTVRERSFDRRRGQLIPEEIQLVPIGRTGMAGEPAAWSRP